MQGQWIGQYSGTNQGIMVADLEPINAGYEGHAFVFDSDRALPGTLARLQLPTRDDAQTIQASLQCLWPLGGLIAPAELTAAYPGVSIPELAEVRLRKNGSSLEVAWSTALGTNGAGTLVLSDGSQPSKVDARVVTWKDYKDIILSFPSRQYVYRGQSTIARLRTSFHRTHRKDLVRYVNQDIPSLRRELTAQTRHFFRIDDSFENAAFWNLLQHHGYPTPLLDWSYSPFVAAYFAFRNFRRTPELGSKVRVYVFNSAAWARDWRPMQQVTYAPPHLTLLETLALENPRALPQQSLSSVTNCDDIESYVNFCESQSGNNYLQAFDLDFSERHAVLTELSLMGITAASLFPGLDGACEEVKTRFFGYNV